MEYSKILNPSNTAQTEKLFGSDQVENNAGGYVYKIDKWQQLERFLILGTQGGTYYALQKKLTVENTEVILECLNEDGVKTIDAVMDVYLNGRSAKVDAALFVLALGSSLKDTGSSNNKPVRVYAMKHIKDLRTASHLFRFISYVSDMRGWGRGLKSAVSAWYESRSAEELSYQILKYRNRYGWTHRDVLRVTHPKPTTKEHENLFAYVIHGFDESKKIKPSVLPNLIYQYEILHGINSVNNVEIDGIAQTKLSWEMIPQRFLKADSPNSTKLWEQLITTSMPLHALTRHLGMLTERDILSSFDRGVTKVVVERLTNKEAVRRSRIHPFQVLLAKEVYEDGSGNRGSLVWDPIHDVSEALDDMFSHAMGNVTPTNKNVMIALDVSGSMWGSYLYNTSVSAADAAAAMTSVHINTDKMAKVFTFSSEFKPLLVRNGSLGAIDDAMRGVGGFFGGTDCALPMMYALEKNLNIDAFVVYTDNETWYGQVHPSEALKMYQDKINKNAKLIVVGMTATGFSIAEPGNPYMLDVVGMDASTPQAINTFIKEPC